MAEHADVLILGGGVIGLTTAYFLAQEGVRVALIDKGDFGREASWAGAGIIPPGNSRRAGTPIDLLRSFSSEMYPDLSRRLREQTGIDNGYQVCGGLELAEAGDDLPIEEWQTEGIAYPRVSRRCTAGGGTEPLPCPAPRLSSAGHGPGAQPASRQSAAGRMRNARRPSLSASRGDWIRSTRPAH